LFVPGAREQFVLLREQFFNLAKAMGDDERENEPANSENERADGQKKANYSTSSGSSVAHGHLIFFAGYSPSDSFSATGFCLAIKKCKKKRADAKRTPPKK